VEATLRRRSNLRNVMTPGSLSHLFDDAIVGSKNSGNESGSHKASQKCQLELCLHLVSPQYVNGN
jgi:hypothetical protein